MNVQHNLMVKLKLYIRQGCWLCDAGEEVMNGIRGRREFDIERIDIATDDGLYELYRFDVPVLEFPDGEMMHGRLIRKRIEEKLDALDDIEKQ